MPKKPNVIFLRILPQQLLQMFDEAFPNLLIRNWFGLGGAWSTIRATPKIFVADFQDFQACEEILLFPSNSNEPRVAVPVNLIGKSVRDRNSTTITPARRPEMTERSVERKPVEVDGAASCQQGHAWEFDGFMASCIAP